MAVSVENVTNNFNFVSASTFFMPPTVLYKHAESRVVLYRLQKERRIGMFVLLVQILEYYPHFKIIGKFVARV